MQTYLADISIRFNASNQEDARRLVTILASRLIDLMPSLKVTNVEVEEA